MGSVSGLDEAELLRAVAPHRVSRRQLLRLREEHCLPKRLPVGGSGRGHPPRWVYPIGSDAQLRAVLELRSRGVRSFVVLRIGLWVQGFDVLGRKKLIAALPTPLPEIADEARDQVARTLVEDPTRLGPLARLFDQRRETDWMALADEIADAARGGTVAEADSELGRWLGGPAEIAGLHEVETALRTASREEFDAARLAIRAILDAGRGVSAMQRAARLGAKSDRRLREAHGRGVELSLAAAYPFAEALSRDLTTFAIAVGGLIAYGRRGESMPEGAVDAASLENAADLIAAHRQEVPALAHLMGPGALHELTLNELAAEGGDAAAAERVTAQYERLRAAADAHRPEIEAFLERHPEARVTD